jgi:hypothetical protein
MSILGAGVAARASDAFHAAFLCFDDVKHSASDNESNCDDYYSVSHERTSLF